MFAILYIENPILKSKLVFVLPKLDFLSTKNLFSSTFGCIFLEFRVVSNQTVFGMAYEG